MIVYLDLIFFMNFFYDFLLLLSVSIILKRNVKIWRHLISSLIGGLSIFLLFININDTILFLLKIIVSIIMVLISFKYVSFRYTLNNILYLYMVSTILAGFLYLLNSTFSLDHKGIIFFTNGYSINYICLLIISPIILYFYIKLTKNLKDKYNNYYKITIAFDENIESVAFFDNGNNLKDPISLKPVIIVSNNLFKKLHHNKNPVYVKYQTIGEDGLMECYKPKFVIINNKKIYNCLIGKSNKNFADGVGVLLNNAYKEIL